MFQQIVPSKVLDELGDSSVVMRRNDSSIRILGGTGEGIKLAVAVAILFKGAMQALT
jgi:hypothetical protein